jgi:hypothetical protein
LLFFQNKKSSFIPLPPKDKQKNLPNKTNYRNSEKESKYTDDSLCYDQHKDINPAISVNVHNNI